MRVQDFRRFSRSTNTKAKIISDGCRDYLVEVHHEHGGGVLTDRRGRPIRFRSLQQARRAAAPAGEIRLAMRIAADEACTGLARNETGFSTLRLSRTIA